MPEAVTAYKCKHCGSKFMRLTKRAVEEHEKWCYSLPQNQAICWHGCIHYKHHINLEGDGFCIHYCEKRETEMESMKMKVRRESRKLPGHRGPLMPMECQDFDDGYPESYNSVKTKQ